MTQRFQKATDALYDSFFNGTLAKGVCVRCAVGNIVGAAQHALGNDGNNAWWSSLFYSSCGKQFRYYNYPYHEALLLTLTEYTADELAEVEWAFENNTRIDHSVYNIHTEQEILEDQYNGLCAVFDVLMGLDGMDEEPVHQAKLRTHPQLQII